jgi:hypothetical protein
VCRVEFDTQHKNQTYSSAKRCINRSGFVGGKLVEQGFRIGCLENDGSVFGFDEVFGNGMG